MDPCTTQSPSTLPPDLNLSLFQFDPYDLFDELSQITAEQPSTATANSSCPTNLLEVVTSSRGKPMIIHQGNLFQQRSELTDGRLNYRCSLYHKRSGSCPALLTTDTERTLILTCKGEHNHSDRSPDTLNKKRTTHVLKETYSKNPSRPVRVVAEELGVTLTNSLKMKSSRIRKKTKGEH